jgi:hypothetical protein
MQRLCKRVALAISVTGLAFHAPAALAQDAGADDALDALSAAAERPETALATASAQEAEGDLLGAASTLERALLDQPEADNVRLAYVRLLCRLDDRELARIELGALRSRPTSGDAWEQMVTACGDDFKTATRRTGRIGGKISVGLSYDEDAFGEINTSPFFAPASRDGLAFVAQSQIAAQIPLGDAFVYGDLFAQTLNPLSGPGTDYQFGDAALGIGAETGRSLLSAGALVRHGRIADAEYLTALGAEASASLRIGNSGRLSLRLEAVDEEFVVSNYDGWHYTGELIYEHHPTLLSSYFVAIAAETKEAPFEFFGYDAFRLAAGAEFPLETNGVYGKVSATLRHVDFHNAEFFEDRRQLRFFARGAIGVPLIGRSLFVETALRYRSRDENSEFIDAYGSFGGDLMLVWRF